MIHGLCVGITKYAYYSPSWISSPFPSASCTLFPAFPPSVLPVLVLYNAIHDIDEGRGLFLSGSLTHHRRQLSILGLRIVFDCKNVHVGFPKLFLDENDLLGTVMLPFLL